MDNEQKQISKKIHKNIFDKPKKARYNPSYVKAEKFAIIADRCIYELSRHFESDVTIYNKLLLNWRKIIGPQLSSYGQPVGINFYREKTVSGVLNIKVANASAAMLFKLKEAEILANIASYFGYRAVSKIRVKIAG